MGRVLVTGYPFELTGRQNNQPKVDVSHATAKFVMCTVENCVNSVTSECHLFVMKFVQLGTQIKTLCEKRKKREYKIHKKYVMKYIKTI